MNTIEPIMIVTLSILLKVLIGTIIGLIVCEFVKDIRSWLVKPDWRDNIITRQEARVLEEERFRERHATFCCPHEDSLHFHHDGCPSCHTS